MKHLLRKVSSIIVFLIVMAFVFRQAGGVPSGGTYPPEFTYRNQQWYDSWGISRNNYEGKDGYMPNLAYETLGANKEKAYSIGQQFKNNYASKTQRAEQILKFVQRWTNYGFDEDNVIMNGEPQPEWAWNADEMANAFDTTTNTAAVGDCEDLAFLCATIYVGAGFDAAMVIAPSHAALLIWLPDYANADYYWDIHDGRGGGWIWVESTGQQNPLGWTPSDFTDGDWTAYPLGLTIHEVKYTPKSPQESDTVTVEASIVSAKASVSEVTLTYTVQGNRESIPMTPIDSIYEAAIPSQPKGSTVVFSVFAIDSDGTTGGTDDYSYTVGSESGFGLQIPDISWESIITIFFIIIAILAILARKR